MGKIKDRFSHFTRGEKILWSASVLLILTSFFLFDRVNYMTLFSSLLAVTAIIFVAKGDPLGQLLFIFFEIFYALISLSYAYYGETITYLCMSLPMSVLAVVSWLRNPYQGNKKEVTVNRIGKKEVFLMLLADAAVSVVFYFLLGWLGTSNLWVSTFSVSTSFAAAYLTMRRSPFFAFGYAINDIVLVILWTLAAIDDIKYISVVVCFAAFFSNDMYSFINWRRMERKQRQNIQKSI